MTEKKKAGIKELSPIDVYKLLPKTNCKECGQDNCMAFATKIVNREVKSKAVRRSKNQNTQNHMKNSKTCSNPPLKKLLWAQATKHASSAENWLCTAMNSPTPIRQPSQST